MTSLVVRRNKRKLPKTVTLQRAPTKISKQVRDYVNKTINRKAEHKIFDITSAGTITVAPGALTAIFNDMAKGTGVSNRVGEETYPVSWSGRILFTDPQVGGGALKPDANIRCIWFQWKMDQQGEAAAVADIITNTYLINDFGKQKFHVLLDRTYHLNCSESGSGPAIIDVPFFIPHKRFLKTCHYTTGADSTSTNNLQLLIQSNVNGALTQPAYVVSSRYTYTDE